MFSGTKTVQYLIKIELGRLRPDKMPVGGSRSGPCHLDLVGLLKLTPYDVKFVKTSSTVGVKIMLFFYRECTSPR